MDTGPPTLCDGLEEAVAAAALLSSHDPVAAYNEACGALVGIDTAFAGNRLSLAAPLPVRTALQPLNDEDRPALFGTVEHWIRPTSQWTAARAHRALLCPDVNIYPPMPADQLCALGMMWDRGELPALHPVRSPLSASNAWIPRCAVPIAVRRPSALHGRPGGRSLHDRRCE